MAESAQLEITLTIAGVKRKIKIDREEEQIYRRAERELNDYVERFKTQINVEDERELLIPVALQVTVKNIKMEMSKSLGADRDRLEEMARELDKYLSSLK